MSKKRGEVYIAPAAAFFPADGRMVDPETALFSVSWQDVVSGEGSSEKTWGELEEAHITGAEAAIAWGRERSESVLIRLGHSHDTAFSAGKVPLEFGKGKPMPLWPPAGPPPGGWFTPSEDDY